MSTLTCPHCKQIDQVVKLSAIASIGLCGVSQTYPAGGASGGGKYQGNVQRELRARLAPPAKPQFGGTLGVPYLLGIVIWAMVGLSVFLGGIYLLRWSIGGAGIGWLLIICGIMLVLVALRLVVRIRVVGKERVTAHEEAVAEWQRAFAMWDRSYYCARCDTVFEPRRYGTEGKA